MLEALGHFVDQLKEERRSRQSRDVGGTLESASVRAGEPRRLGLDLDEVQAVLEYGEKATRLLLVARQLIQARLTGSKKRTGR